MTVLTGAAAAALYGSAAANGAIVIITRNDKITLDVSASFIMQDDLNMTNQGTYNNPLVGASITDMRNDLFSNRGPIAADNIPNVFNVFAIDQDAMVKKQSGWREQTQSIYASAEVGFKNAYYLTLTCRNDWPSQLAGPRGLRYP